MAEVIYKLVTKGSRVYIEGKIQTRSFDDKSGNRRHVVEILADNMLMLEQRKNDDNDYDSYSDDDDYSEKNDSKNTKDKSKEVDTFLF